MDHEVFVFVAVLVIGALNSCFFTWNSGAVVADVDLVDLVVVSTNQIEVVFLPSETDPLCKILLAGEPLVGAQGQAQFFYFFDSIIEVFLENSAVKFFRVVFIDLWVVFDHVC